MPRALSVDKKSVMLGQLFRHANCAARAERAPPRGFATGADKHRRAMTRLQATLIRREFIERHEVILLASISYATSLAASFISGRHIGLRAVISSLLIANGPRHLYRSPIRG